MARPKRLRQLKQHKTLSPDDPMLKSFSIKLTSFESFDAEAGPPELEPIAEPTAPATVGRVAPMPPGVDVDLGGSGGAKPVRASPSPTGSIEIQLQSPKGAFHFQTFASPSATNNRSFKGRKKKVSLKVDGVEESDSPKPEKLPAKVIVPVVSGDITVEATLFAEQPTHVSSIYASIGHEDTLQLAGASAGRGKAAVPASARPQPTGIGELTDMRELKDSMIRLCYEVIDLSPLARKSRDLQRLVSMAEVLGLTFGTEMPTFIREECWRWMSLEMYAPQTSVFAAGDKPTCIYFVLDGALDMLLSGRKSASLKFGACVGEQQFLKCQLMTANVVARGMVLLLRLEGVHYQRILQVPHESSLAERQQQLLAVPLLQNWPASALQKLCKVIVHKRFTKGEVVMVAGESKVRWLPSNAQGTGPNVYIVQTGLVGLIQQIHGLRGRKQTTATEVVRLGPGQQFSTMCQTRPRPGTIRFTTKRPGTDWLASTLKPPAVAPFTVVCHIATEIFYIPHATLISLCAEDMRCLRALWETSVVIPNETDIRRTVRDQRQWSSYKQKLVHEIVASRPRQAAFGDSVATTIGLRDAGGEAGFDGAAVAARSFTGGGNGIAGLERRAGLAGMDEAEAAAESTLQEELRFDTQREHARGLAASRKQAAIVAAAAAAERAAYLAAAAGKTTAGSGGAAGKAKKKRSGGAGGQKTYGNKRDGLGAKYKLPPKPANFDPPPEEPAPTKGRNRWKLAQRKAADVVGGTTGQKLKALASGVKPPAEPNDTAASLLSGVDSTWSSLTASALVAAGGGRRGGGGVVARAAAAAAAFDTPNDPAVGKQRLGAVLRQDAPLDSLIDLFGGTVQTSFSELGPDRGSSAGARLAELYDPWQQHEEHALGLRAERSHKAGGKKRRSPRGAGSPTGDRWQLPIFTSSRRLALQSDLERPHPIGISRSLPLI